MAKPTNVELFKKALEAFAEYQTFSGPFQIWEDMIPKTDGKHKGDVE